MQPITGTSLTERVSGFFSGTKTRWQGVSAGAKYCLAMILGAALMTGFMLGLPGYDENIARANTLRTTATDPETKKLVAGNAALHEKLLAMGGPNIRVTSHEPATPAPGKPAYATLYPEHAGIDVYINKSNEFVFSFSPEAAKNYDSRELNATKKVYSSLRDGEFRKMLAAPYPQMR